MRCIVFNGGKAWARREGDGRARIYFDRDDPVEEVSPGTGAAESPSAPEPGAEEIGLRALFDLVPAGDYAAAGRAFQLLHWRATNRFCAACGAPLKRDSVEHAMRCGACGALVYTRINPVVITLVHDGPKILLARKADGSLKFWSIIAGFVEAGETLEEAVAREVREEVGIRVRSIRYAGSQPWPFPNNLMLGFYARYDGGELRPDGAEIAEAKWFDPRSDALPPIPGPVSIARKLIDSFVAGGW